MTICNMNIEFKKLNKYRNTAKTIKFNDGGHQFGIMNALLHTYSFGHMSQLWFDQGML